MWGLGNATVRGSWEKRSYDLQVTTLQAVALLAFNDVGSEGASEVEEFGVRERLNCPKN